MLNTIRCCALLTLCLVHPVWAENVELIGTIPVQLPQTALKPNSLILKAKSAPTIQLLKLSLSSEAKKGLSARGAFVGTDKTLSEPMMQGSNLPRSVQLGMNDVPPLDQGNHGSCVMFAVTAALDAILDKGDYISQLCQLELGSYLEHHSFTSSGWDGSWGRTVLNQLEAFGFTSKTYQQAMACGGIQDYPLVGNTPSAELSVADFHPISESLSKNQVGWFSILEVYQLSTEDVDANQVLQDVKQALTAGDRLTFGVLMMDFNQGFVGAVGTHHQPYDTWVLTSEMNQDIDSQTEFAGHEMLITGYDDDAVAVDQKGRHYKGLLTLRNSWGSKVGDGGNFYMSYDFFKRLTIEVQRIRHLT